jgi:hypothetical protein
MSRFRVDGVLQRFRTNRIWQILAPLPMLVTAYLNAAQYEDGKSGQANLLCAASLVSCFYTGRPGLAFFCPPVSYFFARFRFRCTSSTLPF